MKDRIRRLLPLILVLVAGFNLPSFSQTINEPKNLTPSWSQPFTPFRIVGNVYYVGSRDLACYLITTGEGHILINTGLAASGPMITKNIETLGFKVTDIKILLTTQAHYDHVGAMAEIKKLSGAQLWAHEKDARMLEDGGQSDYELGVNGMTFAPVTVDRHLRDGDEINLGNMRLTLLHHPGHTPGSASYRMNVTDETATYNVLIVNMPTVVTSKKFSEVSLYPEIKQDFANTFAALKQLTFDLWLSSHAGQFNMHRKYRPGDAYNPQAFSDRAGYDKAVADLEALYNEKVRLEE